MTKKRISKHDLFTHAGLTLSAPEWAEKLGCTTAAFLWRCRNYGLDDERTFSPSAKLKDTQLKKIRRGRRRGNAEWRSLSDVVRGPVA